MWNILSNQSIGDAKSPSQKTEDVNRPPVALALIQLITTICKYLCSNQTHISYFQPLEVVGRGSETQLQVAENVNKLAKQEKG